MALVQKIKFSREKEKLSNAILNWNMGCDKLLNIISVPYNSSEIFIKIILEYVLNFKKVIYITNENSEKVDIIDKIKKYTEFKNYSYIRNEHIKTKALLKITNYDVASKLNDKFDLIIYDDINSFPIQKINGILNFLPKISNSRTKTILYSIENIVRNKKEILLPIKDNKNPIIEPRIILTRIDINTDIPFMVYDYLKWSINYGRKVIICVPSKEKVLKVYFYIKNYCLDFTKNIIKLYNEDEPSKNKRIINNFKNITKAILITDSFYEAFSYIKNTDIMVYFADHNKFDYKKLIYICASAGRDRRDLKGEVIFLANEETKDMEMAKNITRGFNKEAWEMGLLRI